MMRFDRFTERAQEAAQRAVEIIQRYGHNQIDTEHILLALIEQPEGVVNRILVVLNVDSKILEERLDYTLKTSPKASFTVKPAASAARFFVLAVLTGNARTFFRARTAGL